MSTIQAGGNSVANPSNILHPAGGAPVYVPKLDFSDARNSMYLAVLGGFF